MKKWLRSAYKQNPVQWEREKYRKIPFLNSEGDKSLEEEMILFPGLRIKEKMAYELKVRLVSEIVRCAVMK